MNDKVKELGLIEINDKVEINDKRKWGRGSLSSPSRRESLCKGQAPRSTDCVRELKGQEVGCVTTVAAEVS